MLTKIVLYTVVAHAACTSGLLNLHVVTSSNWIEMGNRVPYSVLGDPRHNPGNITPRDLAIPTCSDCMHARYYREFFPV